MSCCYQREYAKLKSSGIRFTRKTDTYCREPSGLLGGSLSVVIGVTASHHVITINEFGLVACTTNLDQPAWTSLIFSQSNSTMTGARIEPATFYNAMMFHYKYRNYKAKTYRYIQRKSRSYGFINCQNSERKQPTKRFRNPTPQRMAYKERRNFARHETRFRKFKI